MPIQLNANLRQDSRTSGQREAVVKDYEHLCHGCEARRSRRLGSQRRMGDISERTHFADIEPAMVGKGK